MIANSNFRVNLEICGNTTTTCALPVIAIAAIPELRTKPCTSNDCLYFQFSYAMGCTAIDLSTVSYNAGSNCLPGESQAL